MAEHQFPKLLGSADVENLDVALQGIQQRSEELESPAPKSSCKRTLGAVVSETSNERAFG
jgi:hypothetical protein